MAVLTLSAEQAELMAEKVAWRLGGIMEEGSTGWEADDLLETLEKVDPLRAALTELREEKTMADLALLREVAAETLGNSRDSAGDALSTIHHVKAGRIVEYRTFENEAPEAIIEREEGTAAREAAEAATAQEVVWAVSHAEIEIKAAEGDPRARESLATQKRWDEENRKLAAAS